MSDLKPCPFCGTEPTLTKLPDAMMGGYLVECPAPSCQAHGRLSGDSDKAIAAWNHRANEAELTRLQATLEKVKELPRHEAAMLPRDSKERWPTGKWIRAADLERVLK